MTNPLPSLRRSAPWLALLCLLVLRLSWLDAYPLNSDESQHAHVAWIWTQGQLPYRDAFDNHGPLFGLLHAPLLALLGPRADILTWLRLAMQAWYALGLFACWRVGRRLYGPRVAFMAILLIALYPRFFLISGQFRTDDLWAALWLLALALGLAANGRRWRWLLAGLAAGAALCVSQKTILLLLTALVAALVVLLAARRRWSWSAAACVLLGVLCLPALFLAWLASEGMLGVAWYDLVGYNTAATGQLVEHGRRLLFVPAALATIGAALVWLRRGRDPATPAKVFLTLQSLLFLLLVWFVWPLITRQDFLPVIPPLLLALCGSLAELAPSLWRGRLPWAVAAVIVLELALLLVQAPPWHDSLAAQRQQLASVLRYTCKEDTVMDAKGASIFRERPYFPVVESMARLRLEHGLMADTVASALVDHRTMLVISEDMPAVGGTFVERNYLLAAQRIRIAGLRLPALNQQDFSLQVPGDYTLVDAHGEVTARIDGGPPASHWQLAAGSHRLEVAQGEPLLLLWSQAWQRGWRPDDLLVAARR